MQNRDIVPNSPSEKNCGDSLATGDPVLPQRTESFGINKTFDHQTLGIWDLYIEKPSIRWHIPWSPFIREKAQLIGDLQYLWRAVRDLSGTLLLARMAVSAALALSPAVSLWYSPNYDMIIGANTDARFTGNFLRLVSLTL